jgi:hypothetical protein
LVDLEGHSLESMTKLIDLIWTLNN